MMTVAENIGGYAGTLHGLKRFDQARSKSIEAAALAGQAIALYLPQAHQPDDRVDVSLWELKLGSMFEQVGDFEKAKSAYGEGAAIAEAVHKEHPEIVQALRNTTSSHWYTLLSCRRCRKFGRVTRARHTALTKYLAHHPSPGLFRLLAPTLRRRPHLMDQLRLRPFHLCRMWNRENR
jgi:hypothetical protein